MFFRLFFPFLGKVREGKRINYNLLMENFFCMDSIDDVQDEKNEKIKRRKRCNNHRINEISIVFRAEAKKIRLI